MQGPCLRAASERFASWVMLTLSTIASWVMLTLGAIPCHVDICGDLASGPALGEHLLRMGEALGMAVVPLTPGGSMAVVPGGGEPAEQAPAAAEAADQNGAALGVEQQEQQGAEPTAVSGTEGSEASRFRTTSE